MFYMSDKEYESKLKKIKRKNESEERKHSLKVEKNKFERQLDELLTTLTITDDRFELIEKLNANKNNPEEFSKLATQTKEI